MLTQRLVPCSSSLTAYGVDGCPAGWLFVALLPSRKICWGLVRTLDELVETANDSDRIFVDIPIGLPDGPGQRQCDVAARKVLGPRRNSVFPAPVREVFGATSFAQAQLLSRTAAGKGISKQAFAISPKIEQVDALFRRCPRARRLIREVHPEVCFWALAGGSPMAEKKDEVQGYSDRVDVLRAVRPSVKEEVNAIVASYPRKKAQTARTCIYGHLEERYTPKALAERFDAHPAEIRRFLSESLDSERTAELGAALRDAGIPI